MSHTSRTSRVSGGGRVSRLASSCPKDFEFEFFVYQNEVNYNVWWSSKSILRLLRGLTEGTQWNNLICLLTLAGLLQVAANIDVTFTSCIAIDIFYNILYAGHVLSMFFERVRKAMYENTDYTKCMKYGFIADVISYIHYISLVLPGSVRRPLKLSCYYIRLHSPIEYLLALTSSNMKGSVFSNVFKFCYISMVLRITCALIWIQISRIEFFFASMEHLVDDISLSFQKRKKAVKNMNRSKVNVAKLLPGLRQIMSTAVPTTGATVTTAARFFGGVATNSTGLATTAATASMATSVATATHRAMSRVQLVSSIAVLENLNVRNDTETGIFIRAVYVINMMFMPFGPTVNPTTDYERVACLLFMILGSLVMSGAAVASLALVISLYMRPEEVFRARFRLIMDEMHTSRVSQEMREKVKTFYRMYWHKQKAVSVTQLLPTFPPTLPNAIYTDIYFDAQQRSQILRDLSYQFLWEVAKNMVTIHYIPGDSIIKRKAEKASIIYIAYGDIEMLTAEDDDTPILRMTRGTMINPCGACVPLACGKALVEIRAATYCTAHVLTAANLWRVSLKHGRNNGQAFILLSSFEEHFERVKRHYKGRVSPNVKYKSSILQFKRNLMALKEAKDDNDNLLMARSDYFLEIAGTYIMRNRADATLTDEADEICLRPTFPCILQPNSSLLIFWHVLMAILILVVMFTYPYYIVFLEDLTIGFHFFDIIVSGFFILDMIVHLSTGASVEEGVAISFTQTCTQQIQSYWFLLDVLATFPIFQFISDGHFAGLNKLFRMPKVFRVLKTLEDMSVYHSYILRFFSYTLFMFITSYIFAAVHHSYMCYNFHHCFVENYTHAPFWLESRVTLQTEKVWRRLSYGLYYAVSTLTCTTYKSGVWQLWHWHNVVYVSIAIEISTIIMILMEALYSATIMVTSSFREDYLSTIDDVKTFMVRNNVETMLRNRFITYLSLCWHTDKAYSMTHKRSIFFDLPPHVYQDIVAKQRIKYILFLPFINRLQKRRRFYVPLYFLRPEELKPISAKTRLFYTSPNEILQNTGDIGNEIFIIKQGICELYDPDTKKPIRQISVKESFGILECFLRFPAYYTVVAVTHVQVLAIPNKFLQNMLRMPRFEDAIDYAKEQGEYGRSQMRREPFLNFKPLQPTKSLYHFPLLRKFEPDTAFMHPFTKLGFLSILRYVFPRFTIRPDGSYIYRYEWFRALCALVASILYPSFTYMWLQTPSLWLITYALDILAYFDILQRMLIGYYNEEGILVSHPASTAAHYMKGAFLIDAFGCLPFERLQSRMQRFDAQMKRPLQPVRQLLMLNRIIQLYRLPGAMDILSTFIEREDILLILKGVPIFLVIINVLTCAMVYSSVHIYYTKSKDQRIWSIEPNADPGGSWLYHFKDTYRFNITESPFNLHLTITSWVVYEVTSTGYNIFQPSNLFLVWILYLGILLGGMMTTYFAVRVISIRANVNKMLAAFQEHMKDINQYMAKEQLNARLQKDVIEYYEYKWEKTGGTDYRNMLKLCDQVTLRNDAILHLFGHTFAKCPILYHCDLSLLRVLGRAVRSLYFLNETTIVSKGDLITDMYFVDYGAVDVRENKEILRSEARLTRGSVFGNLEQSAAICSPTDIVVTAHCHLLQINTFMFYSIILDFPTVKVLLKKYRPKNENYVIGGLDAGSGLMNQWKENRTPSSPTIVVSRKGISNYFNVNSWGCQTYLILISLAVMYLDIFNAGFQSNTMVLITFLYILDVAFILKIPLSYIQPYVVTKGEQRIALAENRKKYFKSEIYYDVVSCLPIEILCLLASSKHKWGVFSLLRLNRLFRVVTLRSCLKKHQAKLNINLVLSTIVGVSIWFSLFVHTTACIWYSIGVFGENKKPKSSWMYKDDGTQHCSNQYVCSLYIILTTFAHKGVEDVRAKKRAEVVFIIILEIVSTMMFMIYVGEFSNIIQYQSFRSFGYYCKFLELQDFLSNNRVSKNLVKLVSRYSLHLWQESRGVQIPYFLETAPPCFKLQIMSAAYMKHLIMHPSFKDCEPAFLRQLVGCLTLFRYNTDLFVVREGEITDSMYLIHNGRVVEIDEDMDDETNEFIPGSHFGQIQGLIRDTPFNYSYKTTSKAEVLTLSLDNWEHLLQHFPNSRYSIFKHYPNHPYARHPEDEPKNQQKDNPKDEIKRQMMARRKTEHELKVRSVPLEQRNVSPSESLTYVPFYTPPTKSSTGTVPKSDPSAPKSTADGADGTVTSEASSGKMALLPTSDTGEKKIGATSSPSKIDPIPTSVSGKDASQTPSTPSMIAPLPALFTTKEKSEVTSTPSKIAPLSTSITGQKAPGGTNGSEKKTTSSVFVTDKKAFGASSAPDKIAPFPASVSAKAPKASGAMPAALVAEVAGDAVTGTAIAGTPAVAGSLAPTGVLAAGTIPTTLLSSEAVPDKISDFEIKKSNDALSSKSEIQESAFGQEKTASSSEAMIPRPTAVIEKLQNVPLKKMYREETAALSDKKEPILLTIETFGKKGTEIGDERHSVPYLTTEILKKKPSDQNEDTLLPDRGITTTKIFQSLTKLPSPSDETQTLPVSDQMDYDTKKTTELSDETDRSMTRLLEKNSDTIYVSQLFLPLKTALESNSEAIPDSENGGIEEIPNIEAIASVTKVIDEVVLSQSIKPGQSKTPDKTSIWPLHSRSVKLADKKEMVQGVLSPIVKEPPSASTSKNYLLSDRSSLKYEESVPYLDYYTNDNNEKMEKKTITEEHEEEPTSFMRRMTLHAKRFLSKPSVFRQKDNDNKDESMLEDDIKATSALIQKYEERSKKLRAPEVNVEKKSLLDQYIEKRNAELAEKFAKTQKEEKKEEELEEEFSIASRRSTAIFGNDAGPLVRTIPVGLLDDDETEKISRAPRRSVVIFDNEDKSPLRFLPLQEADDETDGDELDKKQNPSIFEDLNENKESINNTNKEIVKKTSDEKEDPLLPDRGITTTKIFQSLTEPSSPPDGTQTPPVLDQTNYDTKKTTELSNESDHSMIRLLEKNSDTIYVSQLFLPSKTALESKSEVLTVFEDGGIEEIPNIEAIASVTKVIDEVVLSQSMNPGQSKTPNKTSIWPLHSRSGKLADKKEMVQGVLSPKVKEPPSASTSKKSYLLSDRSILKDEESVPYLDYDTDDNNEKMEIKSITEEHEEEPTSFMRRMTLHAKRLISRPLLLQQKDNDKKDELNLDKDIEATSALLQKYEEKSKKLMTPGENVEGKSLLAQYIKKRNAELAEKLTATQKEEIKEEEFLRAPRRSIVIFGNNEGPSVRTIPVELLDDDETEKISRAPRRSVVIFDNEGKSPSRALSLQEANDETDVDELDKKQTYMYEKLSENKESINNAATAMLTSEIGTLPDNLIDRSLVVGDQNIKEQEDATLREIKSKRTELPTFIDDISKDKNTDIQPIPKSTDVHRQGATNVADENINAMYAPESSIVPISSSLKKRTVKPSLFASLNRKKDLDSKNKLEHAQTSSAMHKTSDSIDENEDYESKLIDDDDWRFEKRMTHVRYAGERDDQPFLFYDDDDLEEGPSNTVLPPNQILSYHDSQTKDMTEDDKKLIMMDSDVDPSFGLGDNEKKKTT